MSQWKILLLEVGDVEHNLNQFPLLSGLAQFTDQNWKYTTEPQKDICLAMVAQRCAWPRGRALGGTSVINYMIYTRGNPEDYRRWAEAVGNPEWSYDNVLPYFLKSENAVLREHDPKYHNVGGYLSVEDPFESELTTAFLNASKELGYKLIDYNSPQQIGFSRIQGTIKKGRRHSAARAFLQPVLHRPNLHVLTRAKVTQILVDPSRRAYGINFLHKNEVFAIRASKEVIVSAGALSSPQLLMLSGIGPKKHLQDLGIKVVQNLPVGETLYDHIAFLGLTFDVNKTFEPAQNVFDPELLASWREKGVGPLASLGGVEALGFVRTKDKAKNNYPDMELILLGAGSMHTDYGLVNRRVLKISDEYYYKMFLPLERRPSFSMLPSLLHPKSKGFMRLSSKNPFDHPLFYGNYLQEEEDRKTMIAGIRAAIELVETDVFKKYEGKLNGKPFVGCEGFVFNSDEYWGCALKYLTSSIHHQIATCKMGDVQDRTAVVDHELKVHGVEGLRVADTSVIPVTLSAHTNAPAIMIGEKASDLIKKDWLGIL